MVYDCFTFFNELDLLEIRLNILSGIVDKFVIVEMGRTQTNKEKPLYFEENIEKYNQFLGKIIHIKVTEYPEEINDAWVLENYQRNQITRGLAKCTSDDIILISDLDEIPNPDEIKKYKNGVYGKGLFAFRQVFFYYFLNYQKVITKYWYLAKIIKFSTYLGGNWTPQEIRMGKNDGIIKKGGWHFSYLGGNEAVKIKLQSIVEGVYNKVNYDINEIENKIRLGMDIYDRKDHRFVPIKIKSETFPNYIVDNQDKYNALIYKNINYTHNILVYVTMGMYLLMTKFNQLGGLFIRFIKKLLKILIGAKNYEKIKGMVKK